jgi:hypothetical protein
MGEVVGLVKGSVGQGKAHELCDILKGSDDWAYLPQSPGDIID